MEFKRKRGKPANVENRKRFERVPFWLRALAAIPFPVWYATGSAFAWLAEYLLHYRRKVIDSQLERCFPEMSAARRAVVRRDFYRNFADVSVESLKALSISAEELRRRVSLEGIELMRDEIRAGRSVIIATSHNANWEWTLLILSLEFGYPLDAAYKPLHDEWADRMFLTIRSRFGANMIPAKRLLRHVLRSRKQPRGIAMVADQAPLSSAVKYFTTFFGQETAFFMGPEAIARAGKCAMLFVAVERTSRGHYAVRLEPLVAAGEKLPEGGMIDRYVQRVEAQIRAHPADWLWAYRRWKVRRGVHDTAASTPTA